MLPSKLDGFQNVNFRVNNLVRLFENISYHLFVYESTFKNTLNPLWAVYLSCVVCHVWFPWIALQVGNFQVTARQKPSCCKVSMEKNHSVQFGQYFKLQYLKNIQNKWILLKSLIKAVYSKSIFSFLSFSQKFQ